jgi:hypothetical protein
MKNEALWRDTEVWIRKGIEGAKIEMKSECNLGDKQGKAKFAKSIAAIANSPGGRGYLIIGVQDKRERTGEDFNEIVIGLNQDHDSFQRLIQQALYEFLNPVPTILYEELLVPDTEKRIGVVIVERSRNKPHEMIRESGNVQRGMYIRRGAETFHASAAELKIMLGTTTNHAVIINFTHPITESQMVQISNKTGIYISDVIQPVKIPIHFNENISFEEQARSVIDELGITEEEWQELPILINVPGFASITAALIAEIHGRMGHFPKIIRLKRASSDANRYEFEEIIQLQRIRDNARARRQKV